MKSFFSAAVALSLLSLLASVTNALPKIAVNAEISAVKARTPSPPVGIAFEPEGNFKQSRSLDPVSTDSTSDSPGDSDGGFTISATAGAFCVTFYSKTEYQGDKTTRCCLMWEKCCKFETGFRPKSAISPSTMTPAGGTYLFGSTDCTLTSTGVRWIDNDGVGDLTQTYRSMRLPEFYKK